MRTRRLATAPAHLLLAGAPLLLPWLGACAARGDAASAPPDPMAALAADSARILDDLRFLSSDEMQGRASGSEGAARARARLASRFEEAGLAPFAPGYEHSFRWTRRNETEERTGVNLVAARPGSERSGLVIVVSGHYDHVGVRDGEIYNGADDNASGAVGIAALARALRGVRLRHTLVFAAFDAEESGLRGARAFVASPPVPLDSIAVDLNLDMVARTAGLLWAGGAHHTPALRSILEGVAARSPVELRLGHDAPGAPEGDDWTQQSDHGAFHAAGIPFVYLGVEDHPDYHHATDDFERVIPGEYMNALRAALLTLLALDQALPLAGPRTEAPHP
ncbi:MAG: M28 family peptidase [Longimicrobiales bacterium]|nr:M28 family peptidase [Longimicrobiales bacterium]